MKHLYDNKPPQPKPLQEESISVAVPLVVDSVELCGIVLGDVPSVFFDVVSGAPAVLTDWGGGGPEVWVGICEVGRSVFCDTVFGSELVVIWFVVVVFILPEVVSVHL